VQPVAEEGSDSPIRERKLPPSGGAGHAGGGERVETCPKCGSPDEPGDNCGRCGHHYSPTDLVNPRSTLSGATPEIRSAPHLFIELEQLHDFLEEWTQSGDHLQPEVANYMKGHFLNEPLRDWDISRPAPYFGFEIPDYPGHYWYVWFDAPIGYIASTQQWCDRTGERLDDWWRSAEGDIHHFIGKDIAYFHTLFWPGMLKTAGFSLPTRVHIHGFLTVGGEKMSKSKGTFISAATYLRHLDPSYLRYFYASKLSSRIEDLDLSVDEFVAKVQFHVAAARRVYEIIDAPATVLEAPDAIGLPLQPICGYDDLPSVVEPHDSTLRSGGRLADIAPTLLQMLGIEQPAEMTGRSLLKP
jgi:methionyl-tRNA synthetase